MHPISMTQNQRLKLRSDQCMPIRYLLLGLCVCHVCSREARTKARQVELETKQQQMDGTKTSSFDVGLTTLCDSFES